MQRDARAFGSKIWSLNFPKVQVCNRTLGSGSSNSNRLHLAVNWPRWLVGTLVGAVVYTILNRSSIISSMNLLEKLNHGNYQCAIRS